VDVTDPIIGLAAGAEISGTDGTAGVRGADEFAEADSVASADEPTGPLGAEDAPPEDN